VCVVCTVCIGVLYRGGLVLVVCTVCIGVLYRGGLTEEGVCCVYCVYWCVVQGWTCVSCVYCVYWCVVQGWTDRGRCVLCVLCVLVCCTGEDW